MKKLTKILFFMLFLLIGKSLAEECPICIEKYDEEEHIKCIMNCCKNNICEKCIHAWKYDCPFCKKSPIIYINLKNKKINELEILSQPTYHYPQNPVEGTLNPEDFLPYNDIFYIPNIDEIDGIEELCKELAEEISKPFTRFCICKIL